MRKTLRLQAADPSDVLRAADLLRGGALIAFPTETVYGLGANALSADAVRGIFQAKGRPSWDPLIVHLPSADRLAEVASVNNTARARVQALAAAFWPGPLTLLLPKTVAMPDAVTAGRSLVGCRVPAHPTAQALLRAAGVPVAAPSANRFGHVSPTTAQHVLDDLDGRIDAVLDAGACTVGLESTVVDPEPTPMVVYRAGAVTAQDLERVTRKPIRQFVAKPAMAQQQDRESLLSPGVGLRHYAPEARLRLTPGTADDLWVAVGEEGRFGARVGVLLPAPWPRRLASVAIQPWGKWVDAASLATGLFAGLRALEREGVEVIVCPLPEPGGYREAIRDRLLKAAMPREDT